MEFRALLYVPGQLPFELGSDMFDAKAEFGLANESAFGLVNESPGLINFGPFTMKE